ncbi:LysR family transcriptional regulator [Paracoccus marinaquae]|uniref:LysR family transcriptional regulator n=1 Tax=Paracoccus marinaquae TaxID=2841926 RepID=A0ABS6ADK4_9RHOB|nr:LysR family transcriptional regulator [Paracoccus marinaquae]MBU3028679.1 LysR family transcriptional regulator [Paracoccus marinaquae]
MSMDNWDDIRVALAVARAGTVSGAAEALGIHHATVIRRVDALEARLRARLFQRHARGYALTEAGRTLLKAGGAADEGFAQMAAQIAGAGDRIEGELVLTSLPGLAGLVMPRLIGLMQRHPGLRLRYLTDTRLFRLGAGEAHVAIRAGSQPTEPDYVTRPLAATHERLYAAQSYLDAHGPIEDVTGHRFALPGPEEQGAPMIRWLIAHVPAANLLMVSNDAAAREAVIRAGLAAGAIPAQRAGGLVEAMALPEWQSQLWLVTHVDLHRTPKVQAALAALRGG